MFTITFANPKGGSGKTTSAMLLAEQIHHAGGRVAILDCDPNRNIMQWADQRSEQGRTVPYVLRSATEADFLDAVEGFEGKADYLIIDLEGTASTLVTYAISRSDLVLIPFEPTPMEARQAARAVQLIRNTGRAMGNRTIPHALLLTRVNAAFQTSDEKDVRKEMEGASMPVLTTAIVRRAAYTRLFRDGFLLSELFEQSQEEVKNSTSSQQERVLKPLESAIANAREFTQEVVNQLTQKEAA
jgi:chromosome partitioning protein